MSFVERFETDTSSGWTEVTLLKNCEMQQVTQVAAILTEKLNIHFTTKMNDMDSLYWDFIYEGAELCLHYNIYVGISLLPLRFEQAKEWENEAVVKLARDIGSTELLL